MTLAATIDSMRRKNLRIVKRQSSARVRQAVRLFKNGYAPRSVRHHNIRAWLAAVERLGAKWLYAQPVQLVRKEKQ